MTSERKARARSDSEDPRLAGSEPSELYQISIYTDGSCIGNPGPGGWAALILAEPKVKLSGGEPDTTNNRMEMTAMIKALEWLHKKSGLSKEDLPKAKITVYSDSNLLIQTLNQGWKRKANLDLWAQLDKHRAWLNITWIWVKAHASNKLNNEVDRLARGKAELSRDAA